MAGSLVLAFASDKFMLLSGRIVVGAGIGKVTSHVIICIICSSTSHFSSEKFSLADMF